ncbi:Ff.00g010520.m01.CDS01 [Fusarium sp. VM40]|nr:Ff.00g010520.m01.CDS01 [Fusarium sp. VM40]
MHMNGPIQRGWQGVESSLQARQTSSSDSNNGGGSSNTVVFIVIGTLAGVLVAATIAVCLLKKRKQSKPTESKKKGGFLGRITGRSGQGNYEQTPGEDGGESGRQSHQLDPTSINNRQNRNSASARNANATATVDRNTSVRSVLTLPAYRQSANHNEQVLGREGERDGVDTIIDLPTAEAEEEARNEEMETLYQIRVARRQAIAEREERRERRREARLRSDYRELEQIRAETRAANESNTISELRTTVDQLKDNRQRSVSSVSYADVGVARHDGTRIRANSSESERVGLLSDAASMQSGHQRGRSFSSAASHDDDFASLAPTRSRGASIRSGSVDGRAGSSPELVEADLGEEAMPPPEYEDIPLADDRSSTHGPPPDYPGPERASSQRTQRTTEHDLGSDWQSADISPVTDGHSSNTSPNGQGNGGAPQLPSLRIPQLPEIVIQPSSAHPRDDELRSPHQ